MIVRPPRPRTWNVVLAALVATAAWTALAAAQNTYTWNKTASASWATGSNWTPNRNSPNNNDILVINGTTTPAPIITNMPVQTVGRFRIINNAQVTLSTQTTNNTLTIGSSTAPAFEMTAGTALTINDNKNLIITLSSSATGSIGGAISFGLGAHRLQASAANAITFTSTGSLTTLASFSGNAFGSSGTANIVTFQSGSTYRHNAGSDPFGLAAPSSRVVFQSGSNQIWRTSTGFVADGRTFGNLTLQNNAALSTTGNGNFSMGTLTLEAGSSFSRVASGSASITVTGSLTSAGTGNITLTSGSGGIAFSGGAIQTVGGGGGTGTITLSGNTTVSATTTLALSRTLTLSSGTLTVNGGLTRNAGGSISVVPTYGSTSTLTYAGTATVGNEWSTGTAVGLGVPRNVVVAAGAGTVSMPASDRTVPGDLTITSGTLAMNAGGGNLLVGGNWSDSGTFTANGRTVVFNGTTTQALSRSGGETFAALLINKSAGNLVLAASPATSLTLTGASGDVLSIVNAGGLDIDGNTLTLSGAGGNIRAGGTTAGVRNIVGAGGTVSITGGKTVVNDNARTLSFASTVTVSLGAAVNFGANLTTVSGTLALGAGGSVTGNAPTLPAGSLLRYAQGGAASRALEWSASSGAGYPANVRVTNNTVLDLAAGAPAVARQMGGSLTIDPGSTLSMDAMTVTLTVLGNVDVQGTLALSTVSGGDLRLTGNLTVSGTYTPNARAVFFDGSATQTVSRTSGTLAVDYLRLAKSGGSLLLGSDVAAAAPLGGSGLQYNGTTDVLDLNGRQLTVGGAISGSNTSGAMRGSATSGLTLSGTGAVGTLKFTSGNETLQQLTLNRTGAVGGVTLGTTLTVTNLTLTEGILTTSGQTFTVTAAGSVARTNGFVVGTLRRGVPTGAPTVTFDIGNGTTYAPVALAFASVTATGTVSVSTTPAEHPNVATSGLDATKTANRYWSLTNTGVVFTTYDATVNFVAGDVDGGATPANFTVVRYSAPNWATGAAGTNTATSAQTLGLSGIGDLAVGELRTYNVTASAGANGGISPAGVVPVAHGTNFTFNIGANANYQVQDVLVDGGSVGAVTSYTFNNVTGPHTISASFTLASYTLTITTSGSGTVIKTPDQATYVTGTQVSLAATPAVGWQFTGWTGSVVSSLTPITIAMDSHKNITATFTRLPVAYERAPFAGSFSAITTGGGAGTLLVAADDSTRSIPMPFNFTYSGIPYTTSNFLAVNANGFAFLSRTNVTASSTSLASNVNLYGTSTPNGTIAPWYDDLAVGAVGTNPAGRVLFQTQGAVGSRKLIVQWTNVSSASNTTAGQPRQLNFQLALSEGSNEIEFRYGGIAGAGHSGLESASIGLEDSVGGAFLDAVTGSRSTSNGMLSSNKWPSFHFRFLPRLPGTIPAGMYPVGAGGVYNSLSEAVADINHKGISGPITLQLMDTVNDSTAVHGSNIFPILLGPVAGNSSTNTITIEGNPGRSLVTTRGSDAGNCGNGISATTISTTNEPIFGLVGADYVSMHLVDLFGGAQVDRGLLLIPSSRTDGAQNNTFTNVAASLNRANTSSIGFQQIVSVGPTNADGANSFNRYRGVTVTNAYAGISIAGNSSLFDTDCEVTGGDGLASQVGGAAPNDIGNGTVQTFGIRALNQANFGVTSSVVKNVTGTGTSAVDGILLENQGAFTASSGLCRIVGNIVLALQNTSASAGKVSGIRAILTANNSSESRIYNNFIYDLNSASTAASSRRIVGINLQESGLGVGAKHQVDFNSIRLSPINLACSNACLELGTTTGPAILVRNNIFANFTAAQSGAAKHYAWVSPTAGSIGPAGSVSNRNVLHVNNTVNGYTGLAGASDLATLANWQGVAGNDANSSGGNPQFVSAGNLHISPSIPTPVEGTGSYFGGAISWAPDDIEGTARNATTPDIGADEGSFIAPGSHDVAAVALIDPAIGSLKLSGVSFAPQASYENQGSAGETNVPVRYRIRGPQPATTIIYEQTATIASLPSGATQNVSFPSTSLVTGGFYTLEAIAELGSDVITSNNTVSGTFEVGSPLAGDYPVGAGRAAPFNTLSNAVARLNTVGVSGAVRLLLEDASYGASESFPITVNPVTGASVTNTVTVKPAPGAAPVVTGSSATAVVVLNGTDWVTLDGSNTVGGTTRDLRVVNTNGSGSSAVVWGQTAGGSDGVSRVTVKNVVLAGTGGTLVGVGFGGAAISLTSNGSGNVANRVENVAVEKAQVGIYSGGSAGAGKNTGTVITRNVLNATAPNQLTRAGILVRNEDGIQITENTVANLASSAANDVLGISLGLLTVTSEVFTGDDVINATVSRNSVTALSSTNASGLTAAGIAVVRASTGTTTISNNMVGGIVSNASDPNLTVGILVGGGGTTRVWFNSVWMSGARGAATAPSLALAVGDSVNPVDVRDNLLVNTQTTTGVNDAYAVGLAAGASFGTLTSNFNDLYTNTGLLGVIGGLANTDDGDLLNITEWRSATGKDASSISADPLFVSTSDLHVNVKAGTGSPAANIGQVIAGVTNDFDSETGNRGTTPDIGADEFNSYNLIITLVGSGTVNKNPSMINYEPGTNVQLTAVPATGYTFTGWSGAVTGTTNPVTLLMDGHKNVTATFTINTYTVALGSTGSGAVAKVPNQATYNHGTTVTFTGTPNAGHHFVNWTGDTTTTTNPLALIVTRNRSLTGNFAINTYTLGVTTTGQGAVAKAPDQASYDHGTAVTLTATPQTGWHFVNWTGDTTATTNPLPLVMTRNRTLTANFVINTYSLAVTTTGQGSVAKVPNQATYDHGTGVTLTATPQTGWHFVNWTGDTTATGNPLALTIVQNRTLTANFAINTYTLTVTGDANGSVAKVPDQALYDHGTSVQVTATPNPGFVLVGWSGSATGQTNPLTVVMDANKSIAAAFGYHLTVSTVGNGTVGNSPAGSDFTPGTVVQLTPTPAVGWHFVSWSGDATGAANPLPLTMNGHKSVTATFAINTYTLAMTTVGQGVLAKSPDQATYDHGTVVNLTATPATGWHFVAWSGDTASSANPLALGMTQNRSLTGTFAINTYTLGITTVGQGSIAKNPNLAAYDHGSTVTVTATPFVGWHFVGWSGDTTAIANPITLGMLQNRALTATFAINTYTLVVTTVGQGAVAKSPDQPNYDHGTVVNLTATPATGWHFVAWSGDTTASANPLALGMRQNRSLTATFAINTYTLAITADGEGTTAKSPDQPTYDHGTVVTVSATPATHWHFVGWSGDTTSSANPLALAMTQSRALTATFAIDTYTLTVTTVGQGLVSKVPSRPNYDHGSTVTMTATPATGWSFAGWSGDTTATANPLVIGMLQNRNLTATFTINSYTLTATAVGQGSVAKSPNQASYTHGSAVSLTATPTAGFHFSGWTGDTTASTNPLPLVMTRNRSITANFSKQSHTLTLNSGPNGSLSKSPDQAEYGDGMIVTVTATAANGYHFVSWGGDATGSTNPLNVPMNGNKTISATFAINTYTLTILPTPGGSVTKNPNQVTFTHGQTVQLTGVPQSGAYHFVEWTNDAASFTWNNPITLVMDGNKSVGCTFVENETVPPSVTVLSPNGGETYVDGQTTVVTWNATDNVGVTSVDVLVSRTGAAGPYSVLVAGAGLFGSYNWEVALPATSDAYIKVVARDANGNEAFDVSDAAFSIIPRTAGVEAALPREFTLGAPYPNPSRGPSHMAYDLPSAARVRLSVVDLQGRQVAVLEDGERSGGRHTAVWDGRSGGALAPAGVYFARLEVAGRTFSRRLVLGR